ncbi:Uma2 family endonuclease [candidate division KSB1 bacterium]|nr:Uma2 family endonuclease [candidate division KSB1 bacterium]
MKVADKKIVFTYDDLLEWEDDHHRHELIEGDHFMTPSPNLYHQQISINLAWHLKKYVDERNLGIVLAAPADIKLSDIDVLVPDIFFVEQERAEQVRGNYLAEAPALVVEILSPSTAKRDRDIKHKRYAVYGVREYWIVDPDKQTIEIHDLVQQKLICLFSKDERLNSPTFPDINLALDKIF